MFLFQAVVNHWFAGKKKQVRIVVLTIFNEMIVGQQFTKLEEYLKKWRLLNFVREDFILPIHGTNELIIIRDDGKPFVFTGWRINNVIVCRGFKKRYKAQLENINNFLYGDGQPCMLTEKDGTTLCNLFALVSEDFRLALAKDNIKRPPTAYFLFANDQRQKVKQENPTMTWGEVARTIGTMWKAANEEEKRVYVQQAQELKITYRNSITLWRPIIKEVDMDESFTSE